MIWNHTRILILYTGGFMLFPSNTERMDAVTEVKNYPVRTASIAEPKSPAKGPANRPRQAVNAGRKDARHWAKGDPYCIYLTFDDGPSAGSQSVNELCLDENVSINVFLIGRNACLNERSRSLVRDYRANPLVEIGNHSFTHANRKYENFFQEPDAVLADFDRSRDSLRLENGLTRLPGRNFFRLDSLVRNDHNNGGDAADTLAVHGYHVIGWDLEWRRKAGKGFSLHTGEGMLEIVSSMLEKQKTFLPGHIVILLHDQDFRDAHFKSLVEEFIRLARADGRYRFDHLSELCPADTD
jgi:peptidoglycan/xylan/chitin deacetylase (PgdA/CDA1 family)